MADEWLMVRIRRSTAALVEEFQATLENAREQGKLDLPLNTKTQQICKDDTIRIALQRALDHGVRSKRAKEKAKLKGVSVDA